MHFSLSAFGNLPRSSMEIQGLFPQALCRFLRRIIRHLLKQPNVVCSLSWHLSRTRPHLHHSTKHRGQRPIEPLPPGSAPNTKTRSGNEALPSWVQRQPAATRLLQQPASAQAAAERRKQNAAAQQQVAILRSAKPEGLFMQGTLTYFLEVSPYGVVGQRFEVATLQALKLVHTTAMRQRNCGAAFKMVQIANLKQGKIENVIMKAE